MVVTWFMYKIFISNITFFHCFYVCKYLILIVVFLWILFTFEVQEMDRIPAGISGGVKSTVESHHKMPETQEIDEIENIINHIKGTTLTAEQLPHIPCMKLLTKIKQVLYVGPLTCNCNLQLSLVHLEIIPISFEIVTSTRPYTTLTVDQPNYHASSSATSSPSPILNTPAPSSSPSPATNNAHLPSLSCSYTPIDIPSPFSSLFDTPINIPASGPPSSHSSTIDAPELSDDSELEAGNTYEYPPSSWIEYFKDKPWLYLPENPVPGNLICVKRVKLILVIAGPVCIVCCYCDTN